MVDMEANKAIARQFFEWVSEHKITELCDLVAPTWRMHGGPPNLSAGPDGVRAHFGTFGAIEQQWIIEDVIAEDDKVVVRAINTCRQESFLGIPAHGQQQRFTATFIHQITDGKIVETWRNADDLGRMLQLGARIEPGSQTAPTRTPKQVIEEWLTALNAHDAAAAAALYHDDAVNIQVAVGAPLAGKAAIHADFVQFFQSIPDTYTHPENIFEDGEWAIVEWSGGGTFMGGEGAGRAVKLQGCGFFHIVEGKIRFQRGYWDMFTWLKQTGQPLE